MGWYFSADLYGMRNLCGLRKRISECDDRGATLIEFALLSTILVTLLLGTVSVGLSLNRNVSLNAGASESARFGATLPVEGDISSWLEAVADVAKDAASGDLNDSVPGQSICVAYVYPNGADANDRTVSLTETSGSRTTSVGTPCFTDSRPGTERRVQIALQRESEVETGVFSRDVDLGASAVVRFERE